MGLRGSAWDMEPNRETSLARGVSSGEHDLASMGGIFWCRGGVLLTSLESVFSREKTDDEASRLRGDCVLSMEIVLRISR